MGAVKLVVNEGHLVLWSLQVQVRREKKLQREMVPMVALMVVYDHSGADEG